MWKVAGAVALMATVAVGCTREEINETQAAPDACADRAAIDGRDPNSFGVRYMGVDSDGRRMFNVSAGAGIDYRCIVDQNDQVVGFGRMAPG